VAVRDGREGWAEAAWASSRSGRWRSTSAAFNASRTASSSDWSRAADVAQPAVQGDQDPPGRVDAVSFDDLAELVAVNEPAALYWAACAARRAAFMYGYRS
jgi:hypothetical protein